MPECNHIAFRVHDLDKTVAFYEELLPARVIARKAHQDSLRNEIAFIEPAGQEGFALVAIMPRRIRWLLKLFHMLVPRQTRSYEHMGFACSSQEEVDERARVAARMGVKVINPPQFVNEKVGYIFEVVDPDNNPVEWTFGQTFGFPEDQG